MNAKTDVRQSGTAEVGESRRSFDEPESLPSFETPEESLRTVAPNVALNVGQVGQIESVPDNLGKIDGASDDHKKTP